jgi:hypothetical protein
VSGPNEAIVLRLGGRGRKPQHRRRDDRATADSGRAGTAPTIVS